MGEIVVPRDWYTNWLYSVKLPSLKTNTCNILQVTQIIFRNTYVYTYTYIYLTITNEARGHEFKRKQGEAYERVWREQREGEVM